MTIKRVYAAPGGSLNRIHGITYSATYGNYVDAPIDHANMLIASGWIDSEKWVGDNAPLAAMTFNQKQFGSRGSRLFGGRMGVIDNTVGKTFQVTCEIPAQAIAFRPIFANCDETNSVYVQSCKASVIADLSSDTAINNSTGTWVSVLTSQQTGTNLELAPPCASAKTRIAYSATDFLYLPTVMRTDGGVNPAVGIRCFLLGDTTNTPVVGNGADDFTNWATRTTGDKWIMRQFDGDGITTPSAFTSTTNRSQSPIMGIEFLMAGGAHITMGVGDSTINGMGGGIVYLGDGYPQMAVRSLQSATGPVMCYQDGGWSGQQMNGVSGFGSRALDILDSIICPNTLVFTAGSCNDTVNSATVAEWSAWTAKIIERCYERGVQPIVLTVLPTSYAGHAIGANDVLRMNWNTSLIASCAAQGIACVDVATLMNGSIEVHGQMEINPLLTTDGIHPNDIGKAVLAVALAPTIKLKAIP